MSSRRGIPATAPPMPTYIPPDAFTLVKLPAGCDEPTTSKQVTDANKKAAWKEVLLIYPSPTKLFLGEKIGKALHKYVQIFGYDRGEFPFYYNAHLSNEELEAKFNELIDNPDQELPKIGRIDGTDCPMQAYIFQKLRREYYMNWKHYYTTHLNVNGADGDAALAPADWTHGLGNHVSQGIKFMVYYQRLNIGLSGKECYDDAMNVLQSEIRTQKEYDTYFTKVIQEEREARAADLLPMPDLATNPNRIKRLKKCLRYLGVNITMSDKTKERVGELRQLWNRLLAWHKKNISERGDDGRKDAWKWLTEYELPELPLEKEKRLEKEKAEADKNERKRIREEKVAAKKNAKRAKIQAQLDAIDNGIYEFTQEQALELEENDQDPDELLNSIQAGLLAELFELDEESPTQPAGTKRTSPRIADEEESSDEDDDDHSTASVPHIMPRNWKDYAHPADVVVKEEIKSKGCTIKRTMKAARKKYVQSLSSIAVMGPTKGKGNMGNTKFECKDKMWVKRSQELYSLLANTTDDLVRHHGVSIKLQKVKANMKNTAIRRICCKLQLGNDKSLVTVADYKAAAGSWLSPVHSPESFIKIMLFLEDWMSSFCVSKEVSVERIQLVMESVERRNLNEEEKSMIMIAFYTIADWKDTTEA